MPLQGVLLLLLDRLMYFVEARMAHEFVVMRNGQLETYDDYEKIPKDFQHVIKFVPEIPPGPHTDHEHDDIETWTDKLYALMEIEKANAQKRR